jgi:hypothetical protein
MTKQPADRPAPGKLTEKGHWKVASEAYELARDGDIGRAAIAQAEARVEEAANALHYRLCSLRDEFDRAAKHLEDGQRVHILPGGMHYVEVPTLNVSLTEASHFLADLRTHVQTAQGDHPLAKAHRLEIAAEDLPQVGEGATVADLNLGKSIRAQAKALRDGHAAEQQASRDRATEQQAAKLAKVKASPLGVNEKKALQSASAQDLKVTRYTNEAIRKAATKLTQRGFFARVKDGSSVNGVIAEYALTDAGKEALAAL